MRKSLQNEHSDLLMILSGDVLKAVGDSCAVLGLNFSKMLREGSAIFSEPEAGTLAYAKN